MSTDKTPKSAAERQKAWREKRKAEGYQMHTVWLDPDVSAKLEDRLGEVENKQSKRQELINKLLRKSL